MSNAMLEAMSVGLPVVGVNSGGTRELVDNGVSGWLADPRDLETGLTGVIARLVADRSGLPDAGRAARAACRDRFTWGATVEAYRKIYQECMFQSGTPRIKPGACGSKPGPDLKPALAPGVS
jgi:spore coat protein SA